MTELSNDDRIKLLLEIECGGRDAAQAAALFDGFRWMAESLYPHALIRARQATLPADSVSPDAVINTIPRKYGPPPQPPARRDSGFETVIIPSGETRACRCGHLQAGPAEIAADARGYFWNCPGCVEKLEQE